MKKNCVICGKEFEKKRNTTSCSESCSQERLRIWRSIPFNKERKRENNRSRRLNPRILERENILARIRWYDPKKLAKNRARAREAARRRYKNEVLRLKQLSATRSWKAKPENRLKILKHRATSRLKYYGDINTYRKRNRDRYHKPHNNLRRRAAGRSYYHRLKLKPDKIIVRRLKNKLWMRAYFSDPERRRLRNSELRSKFKNPILKMQKNGMLLNWRRQQMLSQNTLKVVSELQRLKQKLGTKNEDTSTATNTVEN